MEMFMAIGCKTDKIKNPVSSNYIEKNNVGYIVIVVDFICMVVCINFYKALLRLNAKYVKIIDSNDIKMTNFTITVKNFKMGKETQDLRMLKMKIWNHFQLIVNKLDHITELKEMEERKKLESKLMEIGNAEKVGEE